MASRVPLGFEGDSEGMRLAQTYWYKQISTILVLSILSVMIETTAIFEQVQYRALFYTKKGI